MPREEECSKNNKKREWKMKQNEHIMKAIKLNETGTGSYW